MRIDSAGNVGIGTTLPQSKLNIVDATDASLYLQRNSITTGDVSNLYFGVTNSTNGANKKGALIFERTGTNGRGNLYLATNNVDDGTNVDKSNARLTVQSDGNIGIGTSNPLAALDVKAGTTGVASLKIQSGVATASPQIGEIYADANGIYYYETGTWKDLTAAGAGLSGGTANYIPLWDSGTTQTISTMYQTSSNIGIGTTAPTDKLDISGGAKIGSGYVGIGITAPANGLLVQGLVGIGTTAPAALFSVGSSSQLVVNASGYLGIGTTNPNDYAEIGGGVTIGSGYLGSNTAPANGLLVQGNVGIGTTDPTQMLTVSANGIIGSSTSPTETLANTGFVMGGDDLFVAGLLGIEGSVYTDGSFIAGASTTYGNGSIAQTSGETLAIGTTAANLTLSNTTSGNILLSTPGFVGIGGTAPATAPYAYIGATGNLGIGTTDPLAAIEVKAGTTTVSSLKIQSGVATNTPQVGEIYADANGIYYYETGTWKDLTAAGAGLSGGTANYIPLWDSGTTQTISTMYQTSSNIGIGTTAPTDKLDISGGAKIGSGYVGIGITAPANGLLVQGLVGIGTTAPAALFSVGSSSQLVVNASGYLGIGTTNPNDYAEIGGGVTIGSGYLGSNTAPANGLLVQGNVGIGTTDPTQMLTVSANGIIGSSTSPTETLANTGFVMGGDDLFVAGLLGIEGSVYTDGSFIAGASTTYGNGSIAQTSGETLAIGTTAANLTLSNTTSGNILLSTPGFVGIGGTAPATAPYAYIGATGNLGIGTTDPLAAIEVKAGTTTVSSLKIQSGVATNTPQVGEIYADANGIYYYETGTWKDLTAAGAGLSGGTANYIPLWSAADAQTISAMYQTGGLVGVGFTGPDRKLDVFDATDPQLRLTQADGTVYADFQMASTGDLVMSVDGVTSQLVLDNGGNIGIGTTAPTSLLELSSSAPVLKLTDTTSSAKSLMITVDGNLAQFEEVGGSANDLFVMDLANNRIGIGTTAPTAPLSVAGATSVISNASGDLTITPAANLIISSGALGIGTTNPGEALHVIGNARFSAVGSGTKNNDLNITSEGTLTTSTSDVSMKVNSQTLADGTLAKVMQLNPISFNWIDNPDGPQDVGMIAQEVAQIFPEITFTNVVDGKMGINYSRLPAILTKAMQEQQSVINKQQADVDLIKSLLGLGTAQPSQSSSSATNVSNTGTDLLTSLQTLYDNFIQLTEALGLKNVNGELVVESGMNVLGDTTLSNVSITGDLTAGMLKFNSLTNSFDILGPSCYEHHHRCYQLYFV